MDGEFGVSPFLNDGHELAAFIRVLREFIVTNMSILQSSNLFYHIWLVIPPSVRAPKITKFLKPYVPKMYFTNKHVSVQVILTPPATVASSPSS
ncbi:hypothetical protein MTR_5g023360 [Medicago truncatula]|uniref:Uncharacterized protein n=1 Tax=Medicago truncatula TaxID=3880 RepID=G7JYV1_MEDTR|nr:hypothetical protein MTR_5g023360 [Medicago truncatula]